MDVRRRILTSSAVALLFAAILPATTFAQKHRVSTVPATLEIEVLDPGVDPVGNPAVRVERYDDGTAEIDIPPTILVHRYYYSGDRKFQGPMLPGGPSILVFNHPQTGERCYVLAQMMPGAPRVTYTKNGIEYDYGNTAISVVFGWGGKPSLKYRNGKSWSQRAAAIVHAEQIKECCERISENCSGSCEQSKKVVKGAFVEVGETAKTAAIPVKNTLEIMPFGKRLFSGDLGERLAEKADTHEREKAIRAATRRNDRTQIDYATNR